MSVINDFLDGRSGSIPTVWNGVTYKSRFEAEVAQFLHFHFVEGEEIGAHLDAAGQIVDDEPRCRIDYEPVSFRLSNGMDFCPDFRIATKDGEHSLFVEARGYDDPASRAQLDEFGRQCMYHVGGRDLFLVIAPAGVHLYPHYGGEFKSFNPISYDHDSVEAIYFINCPRCKAPMVTGMNWHEGMPFFGVNTYRICPSSSDSGKLSAWTGFNGSHPCQHCGVYGFSDLFTGPHCFSVRMEEAKIYLETMVAKITSVRPHPLAERGWARSKIERLCDSVGMK